MRIFPNRQRITVWRAVAAALLLLAPVAARAGVQSMVLPVRGMTCVLCTRGVEESIKRLDGVGDVTADLSTGRVRVTAAEGKTLDIQQVKDRVVRAGFATGGECDLVASGRFTVDPQGRITFRITGAADGYQVLEGSQLFHLFKKHPGLRGEFVIGFRLHDHPNWKPAAISITSFEARPSPALAAGR
jgi:copper chaperone CopZ